MSGAVILLSKCFQQEGKKSSQGKKEQEGEEFTAKERSQKKHILARRMINHWQKILTMITDFFVS